MKWLQLMAGCLALGSARMGILNLFRILMPPSIKVAKEVRRTCGACHMVAGREVEAAATKLDTERKLTLWNAVQTNLCCIETHSAYTYTYIWLSFQ